MSRRGFNKQSVMQGAIVLTAAGIFIRVLGALYRVPLGRLLGDEGLGIYGVPNQFYLLFFTLSSAGIPVAVSRLVSQKMAAGCYCDAYRAFRLARFSMLVIGTASSLFLFFGAGWFVESGIVADPRCLNGLRAISPIVFFAAVTAAYRGLFQGVRNMTAVAVSQVADQVMLVTGTLLLAYLFLPYGLTWGAAGGNLGAIPGAVAATGIMLIYHWLYRGDFYYLTAKDVSGSRESALSLLKKIFYTALPISFASIAMAITNIMDNKLIIDGMQLTGYSIHKATAFYGQFTQMAMSFINISIAFATALGASLVPFAAECYSNGNISGIRRQLSRAVRLAMGISLPAAAGLLVLAPHLTELVYANKSAGVSLAWVSPVVIFWSLYLVTSGVLQGLERADIPVRNLTAGIFFKVIITYYFITSSLGIRAAALGTVVMFVVSSFLNINSVRRRVGFKMDIGKMLLRPGIAVLIMAVGTLWVYSYLVQQVGNNWATLAAVGAGALIYAPAAVLVGGVSSREVAAVPRIGEKLAVILRKLGR
ncbi:MAG: polysaccharide biosynthesis protein [Clostridiales bacterium]|nr:polysaccharide biosynthesis protein [Clostridiales bacterium]MCF8022087.1 polysaccharide biosynthesis protein [Clostridiales bacterium]